jgi:hypothetical protein
MSTKNDNQPPRFVSVSRSVTPYDYGYTDDDKWCGNGRFKPSKTDYKKAIKLTKEQFLKFEKLNKLIGCVVDFRIGKKIYKATIVAVSLPDDMVTVYPTGEIHESTGKEFAYKYCSYPYYFNLAIKGRSNFWSSRIDNIDINEIVRQPVKYFKYKNLESITDKYM